MIHSAEENRHLLGRRAFLASGTGFGLCCAARSLASVVDNSAPRLRVGVLSDIHIRTSPGKVERAVRGSSDNFLEALEYFRERKVDAVVIAGDMADLGFVDELMVVGDLWRKVFPGNKGVDGAHVEKVFVCGNHDAAGYSIGQTSRAAIKERFARSIAANYRHAWRIAFDEEWTPHYRKEVKGYTFFGTHWGHEKTFPDFFVKEKASLNPHRPFFHVQHPHLRDTVYGDWAWGADGGETTAVLSAFPNAVSISGHSHFSLTDEHSIWQGEFTAVGAASLSYISMPGRNFSRENSRSAQKRQEGAHMKALETGRQGMMMDVFDDRIVFDRRENAVNESLGDAWVVPLPFARESAPFAYARRETAFPPPQFPKGASAWVKFFPKAACHKRAKLKTTYGSEPQIYVSFTPADSGQGRGRVFDYEIVGRSAGGTEKTRYVFAKGFDRAAKPLRAAVRDGCPFPVADFPEGEDVEFTIYPRNSFFRRGNALKVMFKHTSKEKT